MFFWLQRKISFIAYKFHFLELQSGNLLANSSEFIIRNQTSDGDISIYINDGGVDTRAINIDGATANVLVDKDLNVAGNTSSIVGHGIGRGFMELGVDVEGSGSDRSCYIDFHTQNTPAIDYNARIIRNSGANGAWIFTNQGTGGIQLTGLTAKTISGTGFSGSGVAGWLVIDTNGHIAIDTRTFP